MIWSILSRRWRERVKAQKKVNQETTGDTVTTALLSPQTMGKAVQKIEKVMPKSPRNTSCHMYGRGQFNFGKQFNPPIGFA